MSIRSKKLYMLIKLCMLTLFIVLHNAHALCIGSFPSTCLIEMEQEEAMEALDYILGKYEQIDMKVTGEPADVRGKRIIRGSNEELHISFKYVDNTPHDILQYCTFILRIQTGECEAISSVCNTFLARTPRPLLNLAALTVCDDDAVPEIATSTEFTNVAVVTKPTNSNEEDN